MYVVQMIDTLVHGGAQQLLITFAKAANRDGIKLTVISLSEDDGSKFINELKSLNVPLYFFPTNRILNFDNLHKIIKLLRRERPDIVHSHLTYSNILGSLSGWLMRLPVVAHLHNIDVDPGLRAPRTTWAEIWALRVCVSKIIACGPAVAKKYKALINNKTIITIPNSVDVSIWNAEQKMRTDLRRKLTGDENRLIVISVGRLVDQKGFGDLLDSFNVLRHTNPNVFLVIVGDGILHDVLNEKIKLLNLTEHVKMLGKRDDVIKLLSVSDLFVLSSHWEGLPISILEAMSVGLPVVATDVGDVSWAVGSSGMIVPACEVDLFASAMSDILSDPERRKELSRLEKQQIDERFSPVRWFEDIKNIYKSLID